MFHDALARETKKTKKRTDRGEEYRTRFPYGVVFLWLLFLGVGAYIVLLSPLLFVTDIEVQDTQSVTKDEVRAEVESVFGTKRWLVFPAKNLLVIPTRTLEERMKSLSPLVERIRISRVFPNRVQIAVIERPELLLWCAGGPCALVNEKGEAWSHEKIFDTRYDSQRLSVIDTSALPIEFGQELPVGEYLNYFSRFAHEAVAQMGVGVELQATTPSRYSRELRLTTIEGWSVLVNIDIPLDETLLSLRSFLDEQKKQHVPSSFTVIDARVPGRIFITTGEKEPTQDSEDIHE